MERIRKSPSPLKRLLIQLSPFGLVSPEQAILSLELRRIPWKGSFKQFMRKTAGWLVGTICITFIAWVIISSLLLLITRQSALQLMVLTQGTIIFVMVGITGLGLYSLLLDFTSIRAALGSINTDIHSGRLDMIRLTTMREGQFILAKHGASQLRAWRSTMLLVGARLGLMVVLCIWFPLYAAADMRLDMASMMYALPTMPVVEAIRSSDPLLYLIGIIITLFAFLSFGTTFVLEPIWRMRGMTAAGMAVSARITDHSLASISAFAVLLAGWMAQFVIILGTIIFGFFLAPFGIFLLPFVSFACVFLVYMAFFSLVKAVSLRVVARKIVTLAD